MHPIKHFLTITKHRHLVMHYCFKCGLYKQGLLHDLSKYGITEFWNGAKYFLGTKSPHLAERSDRGYSLAWMHHKGRNKHHMEYWIDMNVNTKEYEPVRVPKRYVYESICDRIAASKVYKKKEFTLRDPLDYFYYEGNSIPMHPDTRVLLESLLKYYADNGEKALFKYMKKNKNTKEYK
ncbi:MAG: catalase [Acholeplasmatales bacterium]|nr:catalase [Acholeplasmatales bacterium]